MSTFKAMKSHLKQSYDKQNLTLVVISYEIYETRRRLVSTISCEMTTSVRSSIYPEMHTGLTMWPALKAAVGYIVYFVNSGNNYYDVCKILL